MKALCVWEAEPGYREPLPDQSECGGGWMYVKYPSVCQVTGTGPLDGALDGGSPMSHDELKKWQCHLSLFVHYPCRF